MGYERASWAVVEDTMIKGRGQWRIRNELKRSEKNRRKRL
jgi:hypothetical protein